MIYSSGAYLDSPLINLAYDINGNNEKSKIEVLFLILLLYTFYTHFFKLEKYSGKFILKDAERGNHLYFIDIHILDYGTGQNVLWYAQELVLCTMMQKCIHLINIMDLTTYLTLFKAMTCL